MKVEEVVAHFGSKRALAEALGISQAAIAQWKNDVPHLRQYQIRELIAKRAKTKAAPAQ